MFAFCSVNTAAGLEEGGYNITGIGKNSTSADIVRWAHNPETTVGEVTNRPYSIENEELNCFLPPIDFDNDPTTPIGDGAATSPGAFCGRLAAVVRR